MEVEESILLEDAFHTQGSKKYEVNTNNAVENGQIKEKKKEGFGLVYTINQRPPWYISLVLGLQHYLTMFGGTMSIFFVVSGPLCINMNLVLKARILGMVFFLMGVTTILNSTFGIRLPIVQGTTASLLLPVLSMAETLGQCPERLENDTLDNYTEYNIYPRLQAISGTLMISSLVQIIIGLSGAVTIMLRFVGPLVIAPTITLIGLSLYEIAAQKSEGQWWIALSTSALIFLFTFFLSRVKVPVCVRRDGEWRIKRIGIFKTCSVLLAIGISWGICAILTATNVLPNSKDSWGYAARTDVNIDVLSATQWLQFPYPGQFGPPKILLVGIVGAVGGFVMSIIESVGDYYACARMSGAPPPPMFAVNRGISIEGLGCFIGGVLGLPVVTTSYSENVGAIGMTRVGSRQVVQVAALFMIVFGIIAKFGALFVSIPEPIFGGVFISMFAMLTGAGLSNLQFVDLNSSRNLFVVGTAIFVGMTVPEWMKTNSAKLQTGSAVLDDTLRILLTINMFVGGVLAFFLDSVLPGTDEERGITKWRKLPDSSETNTNVQILRTYDLKLSTKIFSRFSALRRLPICPTYSKYDLDEENPQETAPETFNTAM